jgi:hypothetical protein
MDQATANKYLEASCWEQLEKMTVLLSKQQIEFEQFKQRVRDLTK